MRLCWSKWALSQYDQYPGKREDEHVKTHMWGQESHVLEAEIAKNFWQSPEVGRGMERPFSRTFRRSLTLSPPVFQIPRTVRE